MDKYHEDLDLRMAHSGDENGSNLRLRKERSQIVGVNTGEYGTKYFAALGQYPVVQAWRHNRAALNYVVDLHNSRKAEVNVLTQMAGTHAALEGEFVLFDYIDDYGNNGKIGFRPDPPRPITEPQKIQRLEDRFAEISQLAKPLPQFLEKMR